MSDTFEITSSGGAGGMPVCRVAYTLNNKQPVRCTIIGEQPMFYMDFSGPGEDEDTIFDIGELASLEREIENLKKEIEVFDRFSGSFVQPAHQTITLFHEDSGTMTRKAAAPSGSTGELLEILRKSRMAGAYLDFAVANNVDIRHSLQVEDAFYDRRTGAILIHPRFDLADQCLLAARELRRHWQHRHGALIHPLLFHPDSAVLVNRAQSADLAVAMVRIAWELQLSGQRETWERIENSSMGDLARAFAYEAFLDFRKLNNGQAATAVFECWFLSERCRSEDKNLIREMLADTQGYVFDQEQSGNALTPALISALGSMPYGKNYLAGHAQAIISDPVFNEVRDRSNANFLWFIKFERSFRETEQALQSEPGTQEHGVRRAVPGPDSKDFTYARAQTADIVHLFPESATSGDKSGKKRGRLASSGRGKRRKGKSADILYLRRSGDS